MSPDIASASIANLAGLLACLCYGVATWHLVRSLTGKAPLHRQRLLGLSFAGLVGHAVLVDASIHTPQGLQLGLTSIGALFTLVMLSIATLTCLFRRIEPLLAPAYPLAIFTLLLAIGLNDATTPRTLDAGGLKAHVLLSIIAYSLMALAFSQAILLWIQNYQLKHRHIHDILRLLPPLQTMESLLFDLVSLGFIALSLSVISGFLYVDDLFAQHLAHKTFITLMALAVYFLLLLGRYLWGWRGMVAARWTLGGFFLLVLGYFGSKFVLEWILQR